MTDVLVDRFAEDQIDFDSDSIEALGYDRESKTLYVEFQSGPTLYAYSDVEESTYNLFVEADSLNRFWRTHLSGDAEKVAGTLTVREDDPIQPETKWLTNPGGDSPILTEGEDDTINLVGEGVNALFTIGQDFLNSLVVNPSRFGVKYTMEATDANGDAVAPAGPFEPEFQALSEGDALAQFEAARAQMESLTGWTIATKVQAVTHYFD